MTYAGRMMGRLGVHCIVPSLQVQPFLLFAYPLPASDLFLLSIVSVAVFTDVLLQGFLGIPLFPVKLLGGLTFTRPAKNKPS